MKVNNKKCVRKIAARCLLSNKRRNIITIAAIVLTAVLFTSIFTIALSITSSYETSIFRQLGGSNHGTFKDLNDEQIDILKGNKHIKAYGERRIAGIISEAPFTKQSAEVSFMDDNCAKWSFIELEAGHMPEAKNEVIMDKEAIRLLGKEAVLGEEISLNISGLADESFKVADTFVLVGYWEYDPLCPAHFINVSKEYVEGFNEKLVKAGYDPVQTDLNVMFSSSLDLVKKMEKVEAECGFTPDDAGAKNYVRFGVNPGFIEGNFSNGITLGTILPIFAFALLITFTGYLIIYNVFQISVATDIRFYGLLKTIGTTKKQLKRIIRHQALILCAAGIPVGLILGYGLGAWLSPAVLKTSTFSLNSFTLSSSPLIFIGAAFFEIVTVLISVSKPGRMAGNVSPIEALKFTEGIGTGTKKKTSKGNRVTRMAFANIERNKKKTIIVFASLALSLVILNAVNMFVGGLDVEKWISSGVTTDFIVGNVSYFKGQGGQSDPLTDKDIFSVKENVNASAEGMGYDVMGIPLTKADEETYQNYLMSVGGDIEFTNDAGKGFHYISCVAEGMDDFLLDKLIVYEGDIAPLKTGENYVAIMTHKDEHGNLMLGENAPKIGEKYTLSVAKNVEILDKRTGLPNEEMFPDPENTIGQYVDLEDHEFIVCAYVDVPIVIGPRRGSFSYDAVFGADALRNAVGEAMVPMFYAFDTATPEDEAAAEEFVSKYVAGSHETLEYESKAVKRAEFANFKNMFTLLGGVLCLIIGFVGVLNFVNTVMAGIIARKNEIAVLQAIGMTGKQVKEMLITEGMIYTAGSGMLALLLSVVFVPAINTLADSIFWFYSKHFSVAPIVIVMPVMVLLGILIPLLSYKGISRASIVERIREIG